MTFTQGRRRHYNELKSLWNTLHYTITITSQYKKLITILFAFQL